MKSLCICFTSLFTEAFKPWFIVYIEKILKVARIKKKELAYRPSRQADIPSSSLHEEFIVLCSASAKHNTKKKKKKKKKKIEPWFLCECFMFVIFRYLVLGIL